MTAASLSDGLFGAGRDFIGKRKRNLFRDKSFAERKKKISNRHQNDVNGGRGKEFIGSCGKHVFKQNIYAVTDTGQRKCRQKNRKKKKPTFFLFYFRKHIHGKLSRSLRRFVFFLFMCGSKNFRIQIVHKVHRYTKSF